MATTGELRAIIEELELIDVGDAASYLGEEASMVEEGSCPDALIFSLPKCFEQKVTNEFTALQLH